MVKSVKLVAMGLSFIATLLGCITVPMQTSMADIDVLSSGISIESSEIIESSTESSEWGCEISESIDDTESIDVSESSQESSMEVDSSDDVSSESTDISEESSENITDEIPEDSEPNNTEDEDSGKHLFGVETNPPQEGDIVCNIQIRYYNDYNMSYNQVDGAHYLGDIAALLTKHAPRGLRISSGCAMAYTEGGAGKQGVYAQTNNCFGIRAGANWDGWVYSRITGKVYKNFATAQKYGAKDLFRAYPDMEASVIDYVSLMQGSRYNGVLNAQSDDAYFSYLVNRGYGEKRMAHTWLSIVNMYNLTQYNINWDEAPADED